MDEGARNTVEEHLRDFLAKREPPKTLCPSEVARALSAEELNSLGHANWRDAMPSIREVAWRLRAEGVCEVMQKGNPVPQNIHLEDITGPIRLRRPT
ncbi:hypothetical protein BAUCODRAFT_63575 [Baudoinia panamericana UAMH 10762]|uniref:DUF3253 domain-containing protein n=1 Tax=Baudoinia panamericana (strain UAMH 10762) TaxID=717646 RepID=M2NK31_BAUPA|nr:uncharacterized protein BAUCODRAFT_63575 [Baudoinia panamericana UAMH 10762]EMC99789.1 hypothetical protein BAUCODRAFT_63575 [Baudoinia panamericana UAMH 10762]